MEKDNLIELLEEFIDFLRMKEADEEEVEVLEEEELYEPEELDEAEEEQAFSNMIDEMSKGE